MQHTHLYSKGFTLIELLVVVSIIGILGAVVLLAINPAKIIEDARYSTAVAAMNQVAKAALLYETATGSLPPDESRNIPTVFMPYLGGGTWPAGPWPGSVYDWDNWAPPSSGTCVVDGSSDIIQISLRDIKKYKGKTYCTQAEGSSCTGNQLALYFVMRGKGVPHCDRTDVVGYCVNCTSLYTPAP